MLRSNECNENRECLAPIDSENIDITSDPTGLIVESDVNDHTGLQENCKDLNKVELRLMSRLG